MHTTINLKIYAEDDSVIAEFETSRIRWGVIEDVVDLSEKMQGMSERDTIKLMGKFMQYVFPKLTDELLRMADFLDIKMCFTQLVAIVKNIEGADEKNV